MFTTALTRLPGPDFAQGITTTKGAAPDYERMLQQHALYVETLRSIGLVVLVLDPLAGYPDAYFVEDTAVVTHEVGVIARPGAPTRRGEEAALEPALAACCHTVLRIEPPATLEGGDVLMAGSHFFVGISERTNREGAEQLGGILEEHGYSWSAVPVEAGLHLKSSVSWAGEDRLLAAPHMAGRPEFRGWQLLVLHPDDEYAANQILVNGTFIMPAGFPRVREQLERLDYPVIELDASEARKMDGGLSCMSLRF